VWNHDHTRVVGQVIGREVRGDTLYLDLDVEGRRFTVAFPAPDGDVFAADVTVPERIDVTGLYDTEGRVLFDPGTTRFSIEEPAPVAARCVACGSLTCAHLVRTLAEDMAAHRCPACGVVDCDNFVTMVTDDDGKSRVVHLDADLPSPEEPPC
jgi:hypothetical protein